jgi:hypothetical protein
MAAEPRQRTASASKDLGAPPQDPRRPPPMALESPAVLEADRGSTPGWGALGQKPGLGAYSSAAATPFGRPRGREARQRLPNSPALARPLRRGRNQLATGIFRLRWAD